MANATRSLGRNLIGSWNKITFTSMVRTPGPGRGFGPGLALPLVGHRIDLPVFFFLVDRLTLRATKLSTFSKLDFPENDYLQNVNDRSNVRFFI
jgi:hypothetical protein